MSAERAPSAWYKTTPTRLVVLKLAYLGHLYQGFARQDHTACTVETCLIQALRAAHLVDPGTAEQRALDKARGIDAVLTHSQSALPALQQYSRCGRTDKGVSALGNVVAMRLRCPKSHAIPLDASSSPPVPDPYTTSREPSFDYCHMLNNHLPSSIRVVGWCYAKSQDFSARFQCTSRTYRYYYNFGGAGAVASGAPSYQPYHAICPRAMARAARHLLGVHDFRNYCKMDLVHVSNFVREIRDIKIVIDGREVHPEDEATDVFGSPAPASLSPAVSVGYIQVTGSAFLYHQVRCIITILTLVGRGLEHTSIAEQLLQVGDSKEGEDADGSEGFPSKPLYPLADEYPLILWNCEFDGENAAAAGEADQPSIQGSGAGGAPPDASPFLTPWTVRAEALRHIITELTDSVVALSIKAQMMSGMRTQLMQWYDSGYGEASSDTLHQPLDVAPLVHPPSATGIDWVTASHMNGGSMPVGHVANRRLLLASPFNRWDYGYIGGCRTTSTQQKVQLQSVGASSHASKSLNYLPLRNRPREETFSQKISQLTGSKKRRREENLSKAANQFSNLHATTNSDGTSHADGCISAQAGDIDGKDA